MLKKTMKSVALNKSFYALGTVDSLVAYGKNSEESVDEAIQRVYQIDNKMSSNKDGSEVSEINKNSGRAAADVSSDTFFVIKKSIQFSQLTGGCIDITIGPLLKLWRSAVESSVLPGNSELGHALKLINYKDILLGSSKFSVRMNYPGQMIDLDSLAKGYAADEVRKIFNRNKVKSALIDLGGNIITMGSRPDGKPWRIGIQHPDQPRGTFIGAITVSDKSVVTTGDFDSVRLCDGTRFHRVIDTRTGYPSQNTLRSVTVVSENSIDAEAVSTAAFVMGLENGKAFIESLEDIEAVFITDRNMVCVTDGLKPCFELLDKDFAI